MSASRTLAVANIGYLPTLIISSKIVEGQAALKGGLLFALA
jgi:hypothetical protein